MCYSKMTVLSMENLRKFVYRKTDDFLQMVENMSNQEDDSTNVNNLNKLASQFEEDINNHLV